MKFSALAFAVLTFMPSHVNAQTDRNDTVEFLYQACKAYVAGGTPSYCLGYIYGVGQLMSVNGDEIQRHPPSDARTRLYLTGFGLCTGLSVPSPSAAAMIQAFLNWAARHPEKWADHTLSGVETALVETWPCRTSN